MSAAPAPATIRVFAGTNGAGKSSVIGATLVGSGGRYFNPDALARALLKRDASPDTSAMNASAWAEGRYQLEQAIDHRRDYAFETTLGGNTIPALLAEAGTAGLAVHIWYVGLATPELHIERVRARVAAGGHDIPEAKIRERYDRSRENLIALLPSLSALWLYDNSLERDPEQGLQPRPELVLHLCGGHVQHVCDLASAPEWAKPILAAAMRGRLP